MKPQMHADERRWRGARSNHPRSSAFIGGSIPGLLRASVPLWFAVLLLSACSPFSRTTSEADLRNRNTCTIIAGLDSPKVQGVEGCGAQALATIIAHWDGATSSTEIAAELPWHDVGATPIDLLLEARRRGFEATIARGSLDVLVQHIDAGRPVLIMLDSGLEVRTLFTRYPTPKVMHWAVVSGMAKDRSKVLFAAENHRHHIASRKDFERRWSASDRCMILVEGKGD
jgi:hypothetical protein